MIGRLFCWLGWHRWEPEVPGEYKIRIVSGGLGLVANCVCARCGRRERRTFI